jgi:hypothetical protein
MRRQIYAHLFARWFYFLYVWVLMMCMYFIHRVMGIRCLFFSKWDLNSPKKTNNCHNQEGERTFSTKLAASNTTYNTPKHCKKRFEAEGVQKTSSSRFDEDTKSSKGSKVWAASKLAHMRRYNFLDEKMFQLPESHNQHNIRVYAVIHGLGCHSESFLLVIGADVKIQDYFCFQQDSTPWHKV